MSKLQSQIDELLRKQKKVELLQLIKDNFKEFQAEKYSDVKQEVEQLLEAFVDAQADIIESGKLQTPQDFKEAAAFVEEEIVVLKQLARAAIDRAKTPVVKADGGGSYNNNQITPKAPDKKAQRSDKIAFALEHRHLANKSVEVSTPDGKVNGTVVGIDAPHIIVRTETGHTAPVDLENIRVLS